MVARRGSLMIWTKLGSSFRRWAASSNWSLAFSSGSSSFWISEPISIPEEGGMVDIGGFPC